MHHDPPYDEHPEEGGAWAEPMFGGLIRAVVAASVGTTLAVALLVGLALDHQAIGASGAHAEALAAVVAAQTDGEILQDAVSKATVANAFTAWAGAPDPLPAAHSRLAEVAHSAQLTGEVTILHLLDSQREAVRQQPAMPHEGAVVRTLGSATTPGWRISEAYEPGMAAALLDGVSSRSGRLEGLRGDEVAGYAPVFDAHGGVVAIVRVTERVGSPVDRWLAAGPGLWLALLAVLGVAPVVVRSMARSVTHKLRAVGADARALSRGDITGPIPDAPFAELEPLTDSLAALVRTLEHDRTAHAAERAALSDQLAEATEAVPAPGAERREKLADLVGELQVSMRVADEARSARLVDFWKGSVVVAFRPERVYDLAPGMGVVLAIGADDQPPATIPCVYVECETIGHHVEVLLHADSPVSLGTLPSALSALVDQRREPRIRPDKRAMVLAAVFPKRVGRPLSATLVDASQHGMRLVVPVTHGAVSTWGTQVEVGLKLFRDHPPLRMAATIRSARPGASGNTVLGLELDTDTSQVPGASREAYLHWLRQVASRA